MNNIKIRGEQRDHIASVVIVNPGGFGNPNGVISARLAPLPPSKSFQLP
jgi:hypothetical protein